MTVKAKTTIMAMTIKPYESIAYTEIAPRTHYSLTQSIKLLPSCEQLMRPRRLRAWLPAARVAEGVCPGPYQMVAVL